MVARSGGPKRRVNQHKPRKRRTPAEVARAKKKAEASRKYYLKKRHNMSPEQYDMLLEIQNGLCFVCMRAKGITRKLAVDHDHEKARQECDHEHSESCENCWRGLLCTTDNDILGHVRDDPFALARLIDYLCNPPARKLFGGTRTKEEVNERNADGNKQCKTCLQWLPIEEFKKGAASDGLAVQCVRCITLARYGLTKNGYDALYEACDGRCWSCGRWQAVLFIDHDHDCCPSRENRTIRTCGNCNTGLLCSQCNTSAGMLNENPEYALGLVKYLRAKVARKNMR
jgi:hypothetical protein